jgi:hypothetical protein
LRVRRKGRRGKTGRRREENMKLPERHKRKDLVPDVKLNWKFTIL